MIYDGGDIPSITMHKKADDLLAFEAKWIFIQKPHPVFLTVVVTRSQRAGQIQ